MDANVQTSQFVPKCGSGLREYHSIIRAPRAAYGSAPAGGFETRQYEFEAQLQAVLAALIGISEVQDVRFVRFYLSDAANQQAVMLADGNFTVYNTEGKTLVNIKGAKNGETISLANMHCGVAVVKSGSQTLKVVLK